MTTEPARECELRCQRYLVC